MNKLVDEHNTTYHNSINKKSINADCSDLTDKTESHAKSLMLKVNDRVRITKYKNTFKGYTKNWAKVALLFSSLKSLVLRSVSLKFMAFPWQPLLFSYLHFSIPLLISGFGFAVPGLQF